MLSLFGCDRFLTGVAKLPNHETRRFGKRIGHQIERDLLLAVHFHSAQLDSN
jgi:hypothetical protein